jgi:anti-anti-sigma factor
MGSSFDPEIIGDLARFRLGHSFKAEEAAELMDEIAPLLNRGVSVIALDLGQVEQIDSAGMGMLVAIARKARMADARLELHSLREATRSVFRATGLIDVFWVVDDSAAGINPPPRDP